jgi:hypothetical protein
MPGVPVLSCSKVQMCRASNISENRRLVVVVWLLQSPIMQQLQRSINLPSNLNFKPKFAKRDRRHKFFLAPTVLLRMRNEIAFLLDAAERLRRIAETAPEIAAALRQTAEDLETAAAKRRLDRRRGARAGD